MWGPLHHTSPSRTLMKLRQTAETVLSAAWELWRRRKSRRKNRKGRKMSRSWKRRMRIWRRILRKSGVKRRRKRKSKRKENKRIYSINVTLTRKRKRISIINNHECHAEESPESVCLPLPTYSNYLSL